VDEVDQEAKTEAPTPRRREEARRQGQVPFSAELVGSLVTFAAVLGLTYLGSDVWVVMLDVFREEIPHAFQPEFLIENAVALFFRTAVRLLAALLPLFGTLLAVGVVASVAQVGFQLNTEKLGPDFNRLNPASGVSRLFSVAALVRGLQTVLKVLALALVAYFVIKGRMGIIASLHRDRLAWAAPAAWTVVIRLALFLSGAVALVAILDYFYQRYRFEQSIRMTKEEVKRELKEEDGDPQIKARLRQLARERVRRKMLSAVPKATVVVTNPMHYAVALRYDAPRDTAPVLVAKGAGVFARRIAELARQSGVPVLERPPLARALYSGVKEGQPIPGVLFRAVAEVLAFVFRVRGVSPGAAPA
jgi:flagellar biosynthetic protein FlhB